MATVKRLEDLQAWSLASELRKRVGALVERSKIRRDLRFCDQIRESSRSGARNISEGFGRYRPREFARFLGIAVGSLEETKTHLDDALERQYLEEGECLELKNLASRAIGACVRLQQYLLTCPDRPGPKR
jgi:four helix bundle protein